MLTFFVVSACEYEVHIFESLREKLQAVSSLSQDVHGLLSLVQLSACVTLAFVSGRIQLNLS